MRYVSSREIRCLEYMLVTIYNMCITQCISCLYITACAVADGKEWLWGIPSWMLVTYGDVLLALHDFG